MSWSYFGNVDEPKQSWFGVMQLQDMNVQYNFVSESERLFYLPIYFTMVIIIIVVFVLYHF